MAKVETMAKVEIEDPIDVVDAAASFELGWSLIERFSILVRESGSLDERTAARFITSRLKMFGIPYEMHEPELYLSIPRDASVKAGDLRFKAKPPSFSQSTPANGLSGTPVHLPAPPAEGLDDLFHARLPENLRGVAGKIVVTEGYPMPSAVARLEKAGAAAQVYVNPGSRVHWGICTTIWGTPSLAQLERKPSTPVAAINRPDGDALIAAIGAGLNRVTVRTKLDEAWYPCLLPVAHIDGQEDDFVLAHGHYDSWDVGIGDNAVGDATLLELARIFHENRGALRRSLRVAWWPGHSTGRYAGSAWYADRFGLELSRHCVATVNIDSPGCWRATEYDEVPWMAETDAVCREAIRTVAGKEPVRQRPPRAGDYSFNQLGLSSFFMLLSNIPAEERARLGFYPVGGCGGNIAWHTEKDRIDIADMENMKRDLRVYLHAVGRFLTDEILPLDFRETVKELDETLSECETVVGKRLNLKPLRAEFSAVAERVDALYERIEREDADAGRINAALLRLGRVLVPLGYSVGDRFEHDPALPMAPMPRLAPALELVEMEESAPERMPFVLAELQRQSNKVMEELGKARRILDEAKGGRAKAK